MIIVLGISEQEDFHRPKIPLGKTREIDNEARVSKKAEMKREFNRNQKRIKKHIMLRVDEDDRMPFLHNKFLPFFQME